MIASKVNVNCWIIWLSVHNQNMNLLPVLPVSLKWHLKRLESAAATAAALVVYPFYVFHSQTSSFCSARWYLSPCLSFSISASFLTDNKGFRPRSQLYTPCPSRKSTISERSIFLSALITLHIPSAGTHVSGGHSRRFRGFRRGHEPPTPDL